jgi:hypothetical protein
MNSAANIQLIFQTATLKINITYAKQQNKKNESLFFTGHVRQLPSV